jgi:hypothetical protein
MGKGSRRQATRETADFPQETPEISSNFSQSCKQSRHVPLRELFPQLKLKLGRYYNYYGVSGNSDGLKEFFTEAMGTLWKWINRRSQCRSFTRQGFDDLLTSFQVPRPRITVRPRIRTVASLS